MCAEEKAFFHRQIVPDMAAAMRTTTSKYSPAFAEWVAQLDRRQYNSVPTRDVDRVLERFTRWDHGWQQRARVREQQDYDHRLTQAGVLFTSIANAEEANRVKVAAGPGAAVTGRREKKVKGAALSPSVQRLAKALLPKVRRVTAVSGATAVPKLPVTVECMLAPWYRHEHGDAAFTAAHRCPPVLQFSVVSP